MTPPSPLPSLLGSCSDETRSNWGEKGWVKYKKRQKQLNMNHVTDIGHGRKNVAFSVTYRLETKCMTI